MTTMRAVEIPYFFDLYRPAFYCTVWLRRLPLDASIEAIQRIRRSRKEFAMLRHELSRPRVRLPGSPDSVHARKGILSQAPFRPRRAAMQLAEKLVKEIRIYCDAVSANVDTDTADDLRSSVRKVEEQLERLRLEHIYELRAEKYYFEELSSFGIVKSRNPRLCNGFII